MHHILIIEDDPDTRLLLEGFLSKKGYRTSAASNGNDGIAQAKKHQHDLIISDFRLPDMDGLQLLKEVKAAQRHAKVIIITGYSDIRMAVEVIKYGAVDYVTKPLYPEELLNLIKETLLQTHAVPEAVPELSTAQASMPAKAGSKASSPTQGIDSAYLVGRSAPSQKVHQAISLIAPTPMSVIITGETGTGKEYVAKRIHELSKRANGPFIAIDCGALPKDIAGSEFFGHEKGAFTGAVQAREGKFKLADGGTLFLDEVGNLSYDIQLKLLRVLQEQRFTRIGGSKDMQVDVRIIAATNENLKQAVADGKFREDLYYRLNEFSISLAPLRERTDDLPDFCERFIHQANEMLGKSVIGLHEEVWEKFNAYSWPGNLRELRNVIKRSVLLCPDTQIRLNALPEEIAFCSNGSAPAASEGLRAAAEIAERERIIQVLAQTGNNKSKAARLLNIDRKTLYNKLKIYGI